MEEELDIDSSCSTPYVSAPSSPGRNPPSPPLAAGYYYSAPTSPTHFIISTTTAKTLNSYSTAAKEANNSSFEFDFSATFPSTGNNSPESMTSADELFFNGQIRPMKLSTHLQRPQMLAPLIESDDVVEEEERIFTRGRDLKLRAGSLRRRTRSMSPLRTNADASLQWDDADVANKQNEELTGKDEEEKGCEERTPSASRSSSRRWVFLKEFLYRSKSEGRNDRGHKFWGWKMKEQSTSGANQEEVNKKRAVNKNGANKKRLNLPSPHELHYTANRAQSEEMRRKTFLPYRQGLLGCLGFSSKSYGAFNGFARALNPVSSR